MNNVQAVTDCSGPWLIIARLLKNETRSYNPKKSFVLVRQDKACNQKCCITKTVATVAAQRFSETAEFSDFPKQQSRLFLSQGKVTTQNSATSATLCSASCVNNSTLGKGLDRIIWIATYLTFMGLFSCVYQIVLLEVSQLSEAFVTCSTFEGSFSTVYSKMNLFKTTDIYCNLIIAA